MSTLVGTQWCWTRRHEVAKTIKVSRAQVRAAKLIVERAERGIGEASPAVRAIARAKPAAGESDAA